MGISNYLKSLREKIGNETLMVPAVTSLVFNDAGEVLLHRAADDGNWNTIGGAIDPGEDPAVAAVRETREETGLVVVPERVVGVYSDPIVVYPNGDRVLYVATCFVCRAVGGRLTASDESLELRYFPTTGLPRLPGSQRHRIEQAVRNEDRAYFAWKEQTGHEP